MSICRSASGVPAPASSIARCASSWVQVMPAVRRGACFGFACTIGLVALLALAALPARAQSVAWAPLQILARSGHAMAYDSARGVTVLFGGSTNNGYSGETWEWNGAIWTQRAVSGPSSRYFHAMAYDAARGVTVLFGGLDSTNSNNSETWEWNGVVWTQRAGSGPAARSGHVMAYDSARGVTVLFGGSVNSGFSGETWEWNGSAWTQRVVSGPSPRTNSGMAYDTAHGRMLLFGGYASDGDNGETWAWNGSAWTLVSSGGPSPRSSLAMAYDSSRGVTVLSGGYSYSDQTSNAECWEWSGTAWTQSAASGPSARSSQAVAFDSARGVTVLFGGVDSAASLNGETWEWNGVVWTQRAGGPSAREFSSTAFDGRRGVAVLFGGVDEAGNLQSDTWEWDSKNWSRKATSGPSARYAHAAAFDSSRGVTVLFGGGDLAFNLQSDTWEWDGGTWAQRSISGPSARYGHAVAYDSIRGVTVLFGGEDETFSLLGDTWEWNGTTWSQIGVAGPAPRYLHAMAFDPVRGVVVLFGGIAASSLFSEFNGETWEWNGVVWTQRLVGGPTPRYGHAMAADSARGVAILFGGLDETSSFDAETWEWDGTAWTLAAAPGPSARGGHSMAYDPVRGMTLLFGGSGTSSLDGDTWGAVGVSCAAPVITGQPSTLGLCGGATATFSVTAAPSGAGPLAYQWQLFGVPLSDGPTGTGSVITGSGTASMTITPISPSDAGDYQCDVSNSCATAPSSVASLGVGTLSILFQPIPESACPGGVAVFDIFADDAATPSYQWRLNGTPLADGATSSGSTISGSATPELEIDNVQGGDFGTYDCVVSDGCVSLDSSPAALSLGGPPAITTQPTPQGICPGSNSSVVFTIVVSTGPAPSATYQWSRNGTPLADGATGTGSTISGSASSALFVSNVGAADFASYACFVTDSCGSVQSDSAGIFYAGPPSIILQPSPVAVCPGAGMTAAFTVIASTAPATTATYAWSKDGQPLSDGPTGTGSSISGSATAQLFISNVQAGDVAGYDCVINTACGTTGTDRAALSLATAPTITSQPQSVNACLNAPATMSIGAAASPAPGYFWQWLPPNGSVLIEVLDGVNINPITHLPEFTAANSSSSAVTLSGFSNVSQNGMHIGFTCTVTNQCGSVAADFAALTVCPADFDCDGQVTVNDIFAFLAAWFARSPTADINHTGVPTVQDIFSFLTEWFVGC